MVVLRSEVLAAVSLCYSALATGELQIHFDPPVMIDVPHGNATISNSWPASPVAFRRLGPLSHSSAVIFGPGGGQTGRQARPPRFDFSTSSGTSWSSDVLPVGSNDTTTWSQMAGVWYGFATGVNQTLTYATGNTDQGTNMQRITVNEFGFTNIGADTFAVSDFSAALSYLTVLDSQLLCCCMMCCAPWVRTCISQKAGS